MEDLRSTQNNSSTLQKIESYRKQKGSSLELLSNAGSSFMPLKPPQKDHDQKRLLSPKDRNSYSTQHLHSHMEQPKSPLEIDINRTPRTELDLQLREVEYRIVAQDQRVIAQSEELKERTNKLKVAIQDEGQKFKVNEETFSEEM